MPTQWTLTPHPAPSGDVAPAHLHALACRLVEAPDGDHTASTKPFAAALAHAGAAASPRVLLVSWLDDAIEPDLASRLAAPVHLASRPLSLAPTGQRTVSYAGLAAGSGTVRVRVRFTTPTYVNRGGRQFPLPDPELLLGGLARRWSAFSPHPLPASAIDEALGSAHLARHDIRTATAGTGRHRRTGFTGTAVFGLPTGSSRGARRAFAALWAFAEFAGVGAQTTHGLGHVRIHHPPEHPRSGASRT